MSGAPPICPKKFPLISKLIIPGLDYEKFNDVLERAKARELARRRLSALGWNLPQRVGD